MMAELKDLSLIGNSVFAMDGLEGNGLSFVENEINSLLRE